MTNRGCRARLPTPVAGWGSLFSKVRKYQHVARASQNCTDALTEIYGKGFFQSIVVSGNNLFIKLLPHQKSPILYKGCAI